MTKTHSLIILLLLNILNCEPSIQLIINSDGPWIIVNKFLIESHACNQLDREIFQMNVVKNSYEYLAQSAATIAFVWLSSIDGSHMRVAREFKLIGVHDTASCTSIHAIAYQSTKSVICDI